MTAKLPQKTKKTQAVCLYDKAVYLVFGNEMSQVLTFDEAQIADIDTQTNLNFIHYVQPCYKKYKSLIYMYYLKKGN